MGLIATLVCQCTLAGRRIHGGVHVLAAANPYRLKPHERATPGLEGRLQPSQGLARLVYSVHPLPETMMDHVW